MNRMLDEIIDRIREARPDLFRRYPIERLGIFGSVVHGESTQDSDIDILVEFNGPIGLEVADLAFELDEITGRRVDLVSARGLRKGLKQVIERDVVYV